MEIRLKKYLPVILMIIFGIGVIILFIVPSISTITQLRDDSAREQQKLDNLTKKVAVLNSLDDTTAKANLNTALTALPASKSVPGLLSGLERIAQSASASIAGFTISPGKLATTAAQSAGGEDQLPASGGVSMMSFKATLRGPYASLHDFLSSLYKVNRLMGVQSVDFKSGNLTGVGTTITSDLNLVVYYLPDINTLGDVAAPLDPLTSDETTALQAVSGYPVVTAPPALVPTGKTNPFSP